MTEDHCVCARVHGRRADIRVRIHPEDGEVRIISFAEISERRKRDQTITTKDNHAIRRMGTQDFSRRIRLAEEYGSRDNAILEGQGRIGRGINRYSRNRARGRRSKPGKELRTNVVSWDGASLPLGHEEAKRFSGRHGNEAMPSNF
jgi:hypothetical protein